MTSEQYIQIACPDCERKIRQRLEDVLVKRSRICPQCGKKLDLTGSRRVRA